MLDKNLKVPLIIVNFFCFISLLKYNKINYMRCVMKKIILSLAIVISCVGSCYAAQGYVFTSADTKPVSTHSESLQLKNIPYSSYLRYYNINPEKIDAQYVNLSGNEENKFLKTLSKQEKEDYKYVKKIQKLINNGDWNKVFEKYPNYLPAYLQYYDYNYQNGNYREAIRILTKIRSLDNQGRVVRKDLADYSFGMLYFASAQYTQALNYFKMYENSGDDFAISYIANCYYALGNYTATIEYCKKLSNLLYQDKELMFLAYYNIKNYTEANKLALELLKEEYNFVNLMRIQETSSKDEVKLSYSYKARSVAQNEEILVANRVIADLEQAKLDKSAAKLTQFVKIPKWSEFEKQLPANVSAQERTIKQDEFFKNANFYITKYSGQQLTNAFSSLNQDYTNYVQDKKNEYYQQQQLEAQKALIIEQQRNNILQQEMIREQQIRNYLERQYFYMSRPYYYYRPRYYMW